MKHGRDPGVDDRGHHQRPIREAKGSGEVAHDREQRGRCRAAVARDCDRLLVGADPSQQHDPRILRIDGDDAQQAGAEIGEQVVFRPVRAAVVRAREPRMGVDGARHRHIDGRRVAARDLDAADAVAARGPVDRIAEGRGPV